MQLYKYLLFLCFLILLQSCSYKNDSISLQDNVVSPLAPTSQLRQHESHRDLEFTVTGEGNLEELIEPHRLVDVVYQGQSAGSEGERLNVEKKAVGEVENKTHNEATYFNAGDELVSLSVENMSIIRFIHLVFGKYLQVNYIVDPIVEKSKDTVTIHMQESISKDQLRKVVKDLLGKYKIAVRSQHDIVFLEPLKKKTNNQSDYFLLSGKQIPEWIEDDQVVLIVVPFEYVKPNDYVGIIQRLQPLSEGFMMPDNKNGLFLKARASQARKVLSIVELIDKPFLENQFVKLIELKYMKTSVFVERVKELLPTVGIPIATAPGELGVKIIEIPEISSLLLVGSEEGWTKAIRYWADKLDTPNALGPEPRIFIYKPQNRTAKALADVILALQTGDRDREIENLGQEEVGSGAVDNTKDKKDNSTALESVKTERMVLTIDAEQNALVFFTSPNIYTDIEQNLKLLDVLARQVMVEVAIAEVTLTDSLQYGVEWYLQSEEGQDWFNRLSTLGGLTIGEAGILGRVTKTNDTFGAVINALAEDDLVNILSNPKLVVLDNETASFNVGTEVPIVSSEASADDLTTDSSVLRNIEYRNTGVDVSITPTIYSNGTLRLEIKQSISEAQKNDVSDIDSPLILDRSVETTVNLKSGEYILIAGVISETTSEGTSRIPLLGDIPLLGNLFKTTSEQLTRTELLIQVRPIILENNDDARRETELFNQSLSDLKALNDFFEISSKKKTDKLEMSAEMEGKEVGNQKKKNTEQIEVPKDQEFEVQPYPIY